MSGSASPDVDRLVDRHGDLLGALREGPVRPAAVADRLDGARSTAEGTLGLLADAGLAERAPGGYVATVAGRVAADLDGADGPNGADGPDGTELSRLVEALAPLSHDAPVDVRLVAGAEVFLAGDGPSGSPVERLRETVGDAESYRGVLPRLTDRRHRRLLREHVVGAGRPAELLVPRRLARALREGAGDEFAEMADTDLLRVAVGGTPGFGLVRTAGVGATVSVLTYGDDGTPRALVRNRTPAAVAWAGERLAAATGGAEDVTDRFRSG